MSYNKRLKGRHQLYLFPKYLDEYVVIDTETTGFSPKSDKLLEIAALKIKDGIIIDELQHLINVDAQIPAHISQLTGIYNDMLTNSLPLQEVLIELISFVGDNIIVGHNVHFDINFLYDNILVELCKHFQNDFIDTLRISKEMFPNLENHKLETLVKYCNFGTSTMHRALSDCEHTFLVLEHMKTIKPGAPVPKIKNHDSCNSDKNSKNFFDSLYNKVDVHSIIPQVENFDTTNIFYGKKVALTGSIENMSRHEVVQFIVNCGGKYDSTVTKKTDFLILGNNNSTFSKTSKFIKAEEIINNGFPLLIITNDEFVQFIENHTPICV